MNMPIKVLAVVRQMERGGLESRLMDIIRNIDKRRVIVDIYTYSKTTGFYDDELITLGSKIYYNKPISVAKQNKCAKEFSDFLLNHKEYKIVHVHQDAWCTMFCKGAKMAGVPVRIAHSRTAINTFSAKNIVKQIMKLPVKKYATHYFAVSKVAGNWLFGKRAVKRGQVKIWPNAIDSEQFTFNTIVRNQIREKLFLQDCFTIMHVGNFTPPKNHSFLIDIFYHIKKILPNSKLVLVGAGDLDYYIEKVKKLKMEHDVLFLGSRSDVNCLLQAADVFVFPSFFEGLPGAVLEAQAAGLPCVISEKITDEVCITPLVERLPLSLGANKWAEMVVNKINIERKSTFSYFKKSGFDIKSLVENLTEFYEYTDRCITREVEDVTIR